MEKSNQINENKLFQGTQNNKQKIESEINSRVNSEQIQNIQKLQIDEKYTKNKKNQIEIGKTSQQELKLITQLGNNSTKITSKNQENNQINIDKVINGYNKNTIQNKLKKEKQILNSEYIDDKVDKINKIEVQKNKSRSSLSSSSFISQNSSQNAKNRVKDLENIIKQEENFQQKPIFLQKNQIEENQISQLKNLAQDLASTVDFQQQQDEGRSDQNQNQNNNNYQNKYKNNNQNQGLDFAEYNNNQQQQEEENKNQVIKPYAIRQQEEIERSEYKRAKSVFKKRNSIQKKLDVGRLEKVLVRFGGLKEGQKLPKMQGINQFLEHVYKEQLEQEEVDLKLKQNQDQKRILHQIEKSLSFAVYQKYQALFNQGEYGFEYFIVLKGKVWCLIKQLPLNEREQEEDSDKDNTPNSNQSHYQQNFTSVSGIKLSNEEKIFLQNKYPNFRLMATFSAGQAFGEIALVNKDKRTATMVCQEESEFMVMSKDGFENVMKTAFEENDRANKLYLIRSGEVEISEVGELDILDEEQELLLNTQKDLNQLNQALKLQMQKKMKKRIKLYRLGPNSFFGDLEMCQIQRYRKTMAQASSNIELYSISRFMLFNFLKMNGKFEKFVQNCKYSNQLHMERLNQIKLDKETEIKLIPKNKNGEDQRGSQDPMDVLVELVNRIRFFPLKRHFKALIQIKIQ
ncbi:Cyclic nucleotide-binding protein [Pseudocohnilembus persalinus]|uniref:Cyclic nucleotide-binding protein n=1 Tax=Pseudocohnilembus persalinus TaxID=266149 RepID=A0A0V0QLM9_PSEPJ|nr:Cyclic nucleotide-binding protein [Pseudocohnilembus persalinus]|eukprot:KRX03082.1 Cyclic nucleotide-binding protein [Pseudocohnilembus persalinus]